MNDPVIMGSDPVKITVVDPNAPKPAPMNAPVTVVPKKKKWYDKLIGAFFGENVSSNNVAGVIVDNYLVPTGKRMLNAGIQQTLKKTSDATQMWLFQKIATPQNGGYTDYTSYSNPAVAPQQQQNNMVYRVLDKVDFLATSQERALYVLNQLIGQIKERGSASVLNYYELMGQPLDYNMSDRGWVNLDGTQVKPCAQGWYIDLPNPIYLKKGSL